MIIAVSDSFDTMNKLSLKWGVLSLYCKDISDRHIAAEIVRKQILNDKIDERDLIIFTEGGLKIKNTTELGAI